MIFYRILLLAALLLSSGCVSTGLQNHTPKSAIYVAISNSTLAIGLTPKELEVASKAEINTLENGATGLPVKWSANENRSGSITPGQNFSIGSTTCRRYKRTIQSGGVSQSENATACKGEDGNWAALD